MHSIEELKELYENQFMPALAPLEKQRKKVKWYSNLAILCGVYLIFFNEIFYSRFLVISFIVLSIIGIIAFGILSAKNYLSYRKAFKNEVVRKIVDLINPEYHYNPDKHIAQNHYTNSQLFTRRPDRFRGDDFVEGVIDKTHFQFSEIKSEYKTETREDGQTKTEWHTIFNGVFFFADFNKHIQGETYVLPDRAEKLLGKFAHKLQSASSRGELVKLENPEFEKEFKVYSSSQQEARYVLTPTMMEALVKLQKHCKRKVYVSFVGEKVYCAIAFNKALFEPRIRKSGLRFSDVEEMYYLFQLIEVIISEMNLNTRIWTKE